MTLPVLGGISGWTRTISNIGGAADHPVGHAGGAGVLERRGQRVECRAGGHHVVDHGDTLAGEGPLAAECAAHVAAACFAVEPGLRWRIALAHAGIEFQPAAEVTRDLD